MNVEPVVVGPFQANCFLVWENSQEALVVDPGAEAATVLRRLRQRNLSPAAYLITHGHADHVSALGPLYARCPAPLYMHPRDWKWAFELQNEIPPYYPPPPRFSGTVQLVSGGETYRLAGLRFEVLFTPGHSPGSICYFFPEEGVLFSGDVLFAGSVGRTDLPGGDPAALSDSLQKLARLPPGTRVFAGHGPSTTIGDEKKTNPFLRKA